jgi:hypothetical protein
MWNLPWSKKSAKG